MLCNFPAPTHYTTIDLRSLKVVEQVAASGSTEGIAALPGSGERGSRSLQSSPHVKKLCHALYRLCIHSYTRTGKLFRCPLARLERHLKVGVTRVADILWQREIS